MRISLIEPRSPVSDVSLTCIEVIEPIGIASIAAVLEKNGHEVQLIHQVHDSTDQVIEQLLGFRPELVGFSVQTHVLNYALELATNIKSALNVRIMFGGWHPSVVPQVAAHPVLDFVVIGEGEKTVEELVAALEDGSDAPNDVRGLAFKEGEDLIFTGQQARIANLDQLPSPLRRQLPMHLYKRGVLSYPPPSIHRFASISASRGCRRNCAFCNSPRMWQWCCIQRGIPSVVNEIEELMTKYDVNYLLFRDEDFTTNRSFVVSLCEEILKRGLEISWNCIARIDEVDPFLLSLMKSAGCFEIAYGLESGSGETLSRINKGFQVETAMSNLWVTHEAGIKTGCLFIIGFPWDTQESLMETADFIRKIPYDRLRISFATPFPGTRFWQRYADSPALLTRELSDYTTDKPVFRVRGMAPGEILKFREIELATKMYFSSAYLARIRDSITREPYLLPSYCEWLDFLCNTLCGAPQFEDVWSTVVRGLPSFLQEQTSGKTREKDMISDHIRQRIGRVSTATEFRHVSKIGVQSDFSQTITTLNPPPRIKGTFGLDEVKVAKKRGQMLHLVLMLGATCNLRCVYCFTDAGHRKEMELEWAEIERVVREFKDLGGRTVSIPGEGEPTLSRHLVPLVQLLHSLDLTGIIYTNGFRMKHSLAELLYDCGCSVFVKFNSFNPDTQNWMARDRTGTYSASRDKTLEMLMSIGLADRLDEEACSRLGIVTSVMSANLSEIPAIFRFAREHNLIPSVDCLLEIGRGGNCGLSLPLSVVSEVANSLRQLDEETYGITWRPKTFAIASSCAELYIGLCVTADGTVQPCLGTKIRLDNVRDNRLADIWNSSTVRLFRNIDKFLKGPCTECIEYEERLCYGCVGRRLQRLTASKKTSGHVIQHAFMSEGCHNFEHSKASVAQTGLRGVLK